MATHIFRGLLLASLATALGCGNKSFPNSDPRDIDIAGRQVQRISYTESGWFSNYEAYIICETHTPSSCYSPSAYQEKLAEEVDKALGK